MEQFGIKVTTNSDGAIAVTTPYATKFVARARALGGKWNGQEWVFPPDIKDEIMSAIAEVYGITQNASAVNVVVSLRGKVTASKLEIAGRTILTRPYRDSQVIPGDGVSIINGAGLAPRGGSAKYPEVGDVNGVTVLVRKWPDSGLKMLKEHPNVEEVVLEEQEPAPATTVKGDGEMTRKEIDQLIQRTAKMLQEMPLEQQRQWITYLLEAIDKGNESVELYQWLIFDIASRVYYSLW